MVSTAPAFRLLLLGGATLEGDSGPVGGRGAQRRRVALLAILALARRPLSRDKVVALLWEDADSERARKVLSESLYVLRKALGEDAIIAAGDDLRLNPDVVWCDVVAFQAAVERGDYAAAAGLYRGPFLDGFFISDAPEFEKWVDGARDTLARSRTDALCRLANSAEAAGDLRGAAAWWRRLAEHDPFDATYALGLMRALEQIGQRAAALQHARIHTALLRSEFDADPDPAIPALVRQLREAPEVAPPASQTEAVSPAPASPSVSPPASPPVSAPASSPASAPASPPVSLPQPDVPAETPPVAAWTQTASSVAAPRHRSRRPIFLAAFLTAFTIVVVGLMTLSQWDRSGMTAEAPGSTLIAIMPFNVTGDHKDLRSNLAKLLSMNLYGAGNRSTVDPNVLLNMRALRNAETAVSRDLGRTVAEDVHAQQFVIGDAMQVGDTLVIKAALYSTASTTVLVIAQARGHERALLVLLDSISAALLAADGDSVYNGRLLADQTTSSYAAIKDWRKGEEHFRAARYGPASIAFARAISADPGFALAHYRLSAASEWNFQFARAAVAAQSAVDNSERLPEHYRPLVRAWLNFVEGDADKARREYDNVLTTRLNDVEAKSGLGEIIVHFNPAAGQTTDAARQIFDEVLAVDSAFGEVRFHAMEFAVRDGALQKFDVLFTSLEPANPQYLAWRAVRAFKWGGRAAQDSVVRALRDTDDLTIGMAAGRVAAHAHDMDGARRITAELMRSLSPQWRAGGYLLDAELLAAGGHMDRAHDAIAKAEEEEPDWAAEIGTLLMLHPLATTSPAVLRTQYDRLSVWKPEARSPGTDFFLVAHALVHPQLREYLLGMLAVRLQEYDKANRHMTQLKTLRGDKDAELMGLALSTSLRGHIARARGDNAQALKLLTTARIKAIPQQLISPFFSRAHDRYVIGELYREGGRHAEAREWYGSLLEGYDFLYAAAAHQRLSEIARASGDTARVRFHDGGYRGFVRATAASGGTATMLRTEPRPPSRR